METSGPSLSSVASLESRALPRPGTLLRHWPQWLELLSVTAAIEAVLWTEGRVRFALYVIANLWILFAALRHHRSARQLGVARYGFKQSAWFAIGGAALALAILAIGAFYGTLHILYGITPIAAHVAAYALWATMQQFVAQSYLFLQIESLTRSSRAAVIGSGLLFGLLHIPNPVLVAVTTIGGLMFSDIFRQYRNIYPIAIAHALVALAIAVSLPDDVHRHMRVGIGYLHYHRHETPSVPVAPPSEQARVPQSSSR